jgi:hypothetical protein
MNETLQVILGAGTAGLIVLYWIACRRVSLRYQIKAADLIETYFARDDVSEEAAAAIYITYRSARHWFFMPLLVLSMPLLVLISLMTGKGASERPQGEHGEILNTLVKMYVSRNPLTSMLCLYLVFIVATPVLIVCAILERMRAVPNPLNLYGLAAAKIAAKHHLAPGH